MKDTAADSMRPRVSEYALVAVGGGAGAALRYALILTFASGAVTTIFWINTVGSFLLGLLLTAIPVAPGARLPHQYRLLLGTGFLGGFTTYSALAIGTLEFPSFWLGVAYGVGTVVLGILAASAGGAVGTRFVTRKAPKR